MPRSSRSTFRPWPFGPSTTASSSRRSTNRLRGGHPPIQVLERLRFDLDNTEDWIIPVRRCPLHAPHLTCPNDCGRAVPPACGLPHPNQPQKEFPDVDPNFSLRFEPDPRTDLPHLVDEHGVLQARSTPPGESELKARCNNQSLRAAEEIKFQSAKNLPAVTESAPFQARATACRRISSTPSAPFPPPIPPLPGAAVPSRS